MTKNERRYKNDIYYVDNAGEVIEKVCRSCKTLKSADSFIKGGGVAKLHNECIACEDVALIDEALNSNTWTLRGIEKLKELYEADSSITFAPKYDRKGRRWLFCGEPADFRRIALAEGWKAAREEYDVNNFVYTLLRRDYFTEEEIEQINAKTEAVSRNVNPTQSFRLTLLSSKHVTGDTHYTWLDDAKGRLYMVKGGRLHWYAKGDTVEFDAKVKGEYQINSEKYTRLWYVANKSINLVESPHRHVWSKV